jgi:hypothetical protein
VIQKEPIKPRACLTARVAALAAVAATSTTQGFLGIATSLSTIPGLSAR